MPEVEIPFSTQEGKSTVEQNSRETLVNMFAQVELSGRRKLLRRQRAGVAAVRAISGEKRCIERLNQYHYLVAGPFFYRFDGSSLTKLGTLRTDVGRCTMIINDNGDVMISDGATGYYYSSGAFGIVDSPVNIGTLAFQGGFGIFNRPATGQFYITGLNDFSSVDPLDFATAESNPDNLVRVFVDHNELWLFGIRSIEVWQISGSQDFPFARFSNAQLERGCGAAFSVCAEDNTVFWLGDDWLVYRADGYRPVRVSTHPVEQEIAKVPLTVRANAYAFVYTVGGHKFYTLTFPGYLTLQFNIATGFWNRAGTFRKKHWDVMGSAGHFADFYLSSTGLISLENGLSTDEGGIMERGGVSAPVWVGGKRISVRSFFLDAEMGRADINKPSQVMIRVARDGETFGNERWRSLGEIGEFTRRAMWRNLGQGRRIAIEFKMTDPTEFSIVGADADMDIGTS